MKDNKMLYTVIGITVALLGYFGSIQYNKLTEIEKELISLKIEVVKIQTQMIDRDEVIKIVRQELGLGGGK